MLSLRRSLALAVAALAVGGCGSSAHVQLQVSPAAGLRDAPLNIRVTGLEPEEQVVLRSEERATDGPVWRADATKRANAAGSIVVKASLLQAFERPLGPFKGIFPAVHAQVSVSVVHGSHVLATSTVVRSMRPAGLRIAHERPAKEGFYGDWIVPKHITGVPILFFGGSEGGLWDGGGFMLAAYGHPVLDLAYFEEPGLPQQLRDIPLEYFERALVWERRQPAAHGRRIVVDGASYGGEASLLVGATYPALVGGVVAITPSEFVSPSPDDPAVSAWTLHGKPIPPGEEIAVTKIAGPVFAAGSLGDELWPSGLAVKFIRLELRGHRPKATLLVFQKAGHTFNGLLPNTPTVVGSRRTQYGIETYGGTRLANELAQRTTWYALIPWLARLG